MKNVEIIRLLLEKHPDGVPELTDKPSALKRSTPSSSKAKQPARRSKRKSSARLRLPSVKAEETTPNLHAEPTLDEPDVPHKGRDVRSMAPPPVTPTASMKSFRLLRAVPLLLTPPIDTVFEPQAGGETGKDVGAQETIPTPPEAVVVTSDQAHEMLRSLTDIIDTGSLNPVEPSSIFYRAKALNTLLDTIIIPRTIKMDKDVKDIVWMKVAVEEHLGSRSKGKGTLPRSGGSGISNVRSGLSSTAPRPLSLKRSREEGGDQGLPPPTQLWASKRTRVR